MGTLWAGGEGARRLFVVVFFYLNFEHYSKMNESERLAAWRYHMGRQLQKWDGQPPAGIGQYSVITCRDGSHHMLWKFATFTLMAAIVI